MSSTFNIIVASQKGGVGKTTIAVNLSVALRLMGYRVLVVDMDYSNPSVGFQLGLEDINVGIRAVLAKKVKPRNAIVVHSPTGLNILPGEITFALKLPDFARLHELYVELNKMNYDFIITDTPPGPMPLNLFQQFKGFDNLDVLAILMPNNASCASAIRLTKVLYNSKLSYKFIVNRERYKPYELSMREMEDACGDTMYAALPEDEVVPEGISSHVPAYMLKRKAYFSKTIRELARRYASKSGVMPMEREPVRPIRKAGGSTFWDRLLYLLGRRGAELQEDE